MSISSYIIWLDDMRKSHKEGYDIWRNMQKSVRDREFGRYCKEQMNKDWDAYIYYRKRLARLGVDTGDWEMSDLFNVERL